MYSCKTVYLDCLIPYLKVSERYLSMIGKHSKGTSIMSNEEVLACVVPSETSMM